MQETPPFSSVSASGHLTVVLGRIRTAQLLAPVVHQAGPSFSSTIWQRKGPFSYRCGMAPARALQVPCGMCSPAWVLICWGLRAQSAFAFTPKWLCLDGLRVHTVCSPHRNSNSQRKALGTHKWQIWGLPTGVQAGDSAVPGGRGDVGVPPVSRGSRLCVWLQTGFFFSSTSGVHWQKAGSESGWAAG